MRRPIALLVAAASLSLVSAACGSPRPASPTALTPAPSARAQITARPSPPVLASVVASATAAITPPPSAAPSSSAAATLEPSAARSPSADAFWSAAAHGVDAAGRVAVVVRGPSSGEIRYEAAASATAIDGQVTFVCHGGRAWDGQSGFAEVPGTWTCGSDALVRGFRLMGQPLDAWSPELPSDQRIRETVTVSGGRWTWTYRATSPTAGGAVATTVSLDLASGRITAAARTDPVGRTIYAVGYEASFPEITQP